MAVLIKGKSIKCSQKSRDHYLLGPENEKITVLEVSGFATKDPNLALEMIELSAKGTRCQKPLYSVKINPEPDRVWTKQEVERAIDILEKNLGLTGHARVVIEHVKKGRVHYHALWSRFPPDGGPAKNMGNDYAIHQKTQVEIGKEFKLKPMNARGRDFKDWEVKWASRYGYDIFKLREQITAAFNNVKSGQEFKAKLEALGVVLCRGDKSQFVIILPWGQHKALSSMIYGRPTKAVLRRAMADIDISALPTVEEGKAQVKARLPKTTGRSRTAKGYRKKGRSSATKATRTTSTTSRRIKISPEVPRLKTGKGKTGKGDGAGGGAAATNSALKSGPKPTRPIMKYASDKSGKGNGPERRRKNIWVPVERRRQKPEPK
jgi:hypothetical protein